MTKSAHDPGSSGTLTLEIAYRRYARYVRSVAYAIVRDHDDAEGVVHRLFVKLRPEKLVEIPESRLLGYLRQGGRNEALRMLSSRRRFVQLGDEPGSGLILDAQDPLDEICHAEGIARIWQLIESLPPRCRLIIAMIVGEGLTQREVAEHLGIRVNAVEKQVRRAHCLLRDTPEVLILHAKWRF